MELIVIILIIASAILFWRGRIILTDFPSPKIAHCYKKIAIIIFIVASILIIISIILLIKIFSGE